MPLSPKQAAKGYQRIAGIFQNPPAKSTDKAREKEGGAVYEGGRETGE